MGEAASDWSETNLTRNPATKLPSSACKTLLYTFQSIVRWWRAKPAGDGIGARNGVTRRMVVVEVSKFERDESQYDGCDSVTVTVRPLDGNADQADARHCLPACLASSSKC